MRSFCVIIYIKERGGRGGRAYSLYCLNSMFILAINLYLTYLVVKKVINLCYVLIKIFTVMVQRNNWLIQYWIMESTLSLLLDGAAMSENVEDIKYTGFFNDKM